MVLSSSDAQVVTKTEFAALCNVSPARVSQWIAERKIKPDALVGEGRSAKINVALAQSQVAAKLDVGQRFGNGLATKLDATSSPAPPITPVTFTVDPIDEQIKRAKLADIEFRNRRAAEEERARAGLYVDAAESKRAMTRIAGEMLKLFEGSLSDLASSIGAKFQVPQRDVLHLLRAEFRQVRARAAESMKRQANDMPPSKEDSDAELEAAA